MYAQLVLDIARGPIPTRRPPAAIQGLWGVWGTDLTHVWAVGEGGSIFRWDGRTWASQVSGTQQVLHGIWRTDAGHVWAVGSNGTVLSYSAAS